MENNFSNRRKEKKIPQKQTLKERFSKIFLISFCIVFLAFLLCMTDASTKKMMQFQDDKYALGFQMLGNYIFRLDFAGEKYIINAEPVASVTDKLVQEIIKLVEHIDNAL